MCHFEGQSSSLEFLSRLQGLKPQMDLQSNRGYSNSRGHRIFLPCHFEFASGLTTAKIPDDLYYANGPNFLRKETTAILLSMRLSLPCSALFKKLNFSKMSMR
uniref:Uncharacterized protein n=1 Tax=Trichuris muris TaxID=70415 RepID=A0A5S6QZP3_TRIMR